MNVLQYAGRLYSLDTLDSRFTSSSKVPPSKTDPARPSTDEPRYSSIKEHQNGLNKSSGTGKSSRWKTPEYIYHGLIFLIAIPLMFKTVYDVSQRKQLSTDILVYDPLGLCNKYSFSSSILQVFKSTFPGLDPRSHGG